MHASTIMLDKPRSLLSCLKKFVPLIGQSNGVVRQSQSSYKTNDALHLSLMS